MKLSKTPSEHTERLRYRDTELPRIRDTESLSFRETDDTKETEDSAPASRVATLQEAARIALKDGIDENCMFRYARALKALEMTTGTPTDLGAALSLWWALAKPYLPPDSDYDEYLLTLEQAHESARVPLGANTLLQAIGHAPALPYEPTLKQREDRLKYVCAYLQAVAGTEPFFIGVRDAAKVIQSEDLTLAHNLLRRLVRQRFMHISMDYGSRQKLLREASRYAFEKIFVQVANAMLSKAWFLAISDDAREIWRLGGFASEHLTDMHMARKAARRVSQSNGFAKLNSHKRLRSVQIAQEDWSI